MKIFAITMAQGLEKAGHLAITIGRGLRGCSEGATIARPLGRSGP